MKYSSYAVAGLVAAVAASLIQAADLDPSIDLDTLGDNTLFNKWRPTFHFLAPAGWMNDPCGAMYDPVRDEYHLMYQWHTNHVGWGNISWGHAISKDLVTWTDVSGWRNDEAAAIASTPDGYDRLGIFSGTAQPYNLTGSQDGTLLAFYTSVSELPIGWSIPYVPGSETQSLFLSYDGGRTWQKYEGNPVIQHPPEGWNITGWRDPFFEPWPEMDAFLGQEEPHFYMVLGSGIKEVGSRIPFYSAPASDLTNWTFLGALWEPKPNESFGDVEITGSWGYNFEVTGFFSLTDDDGEIHYYTMEGTEGGGITGHSRWSLWNEGTIAKGTDGSVNYNVLSSGAADWGNLYAATSFWDSKNSRRISWGWSDETMNSYGVRAQGFQGAFGLPRELFVKTIPDVVGPGNLTVKSAYHATQALDSTFTLTMLGIRPAPDVINGLRENATKYTIPDGKRTTSEILTSDGTAITSVHFELRATVSSIFGPVGFTICRSPDEDEQTTIVFNPLTSQITVERSESSLITQFDSSTAVGSYVPFLLAADNGTEVETIVFDIFVDGSLIEVFAGERFALTTRIYPSKDSATEIGLFVPDGSEAVFEDVEVWSGIRNVWPERPQNSSSQLLWDGPEITNNGAYWVGW